MDLLIKKKDLLGVEHCNVFPISYVENILDKETKTPLSKLLQRYNHIQVNYLSNKLDTRNQIIPLLRHRGLFITYIDNNNLIITEKYIGAASTIKDGWVDDINWELIPDIEFVQNNASKIPDGAITPEKLSPETVKMVQGCGYNNLADDEDLSGANNILKFKDREYNPLQASGLGKKILRKNWQSGINLLTLNMINKPNTIYEIRYDFDLGGKTITLPDNCILDFLGGSLNNGNIVGTNTIILAKAYEIFNSILINGSWNVAKAYPEWFKCLDSSTSISLASKYFKNVYLYDKVYIIDHPITIYDNTTLFGKGILKAVYDNKIGVGNSIIDIKNISNIKIQDIIFDGGYVSGTSEGISGNVVGNNLLKIEDSSNILLKNITILNYRLSWGKANNNEHGFYVFMFRNINNISLLSINLLNIRPEGVRLDDCTSVFIDKYIMDNVSGASIWTCLHLFYCTDVLILNSYFYKNGGLAGSGSTINLTCENLKFINNKVYGGAGIDLSNETNVEFSSNNILIDSCEVDNVQLAIYSYPTNKGYNNGLILTNNKFSNDSNYSILRLHNLCNVTIDKCIFTSRYVNGALAILFTNDVTYNNIKDFTILNCIIEDLIKTFVSINLNANSTALNIKINNITGKLFTPLNFDSYNGDSCFIYTSNTPITSNIKDLNINLCSIKGISGAILANRNNIKLDCNIINNKFESDNIGNRYIFGSTGSTFNIIGNHFFGVFSLLTRDYNNFIVCNNIFDSPSSINSLVLEGGFIYKNFNISNNIFNTNTALLFRTVVGFDYSKCIFLNNIGNFIASDGETTLTTLLLNFSNLQEVNVKLFGAKGDGEADDTAAIIKAIKYAYNSVPKSSNGWRICKEIYFPKGIYIVSLSLIATSINILNALLRFKGDKATIKCTAKILFHNAAIFGFSKFEGITFIGNNTNIFMNMIGGGSGACQSITFDNCIFSTFKTIANVAGPTMCSEITFRDCKISSCGTPTGLCLLFIMNNSQAVNWRFYSTDIETFDGILFLFVQGTSIYYYQGSIIPIPSITETKTECTILDVPSNANLNMFGPNNSPTITFYGTRFELRNTSRLIRMQKEVEFSAVFNECGLGGSNLINDPNVDFYAMELLGAPLLSFTSCNNYAGYKIKHSFNGGSINTYGRIFVNHCNGLFKQLIHNTSSTATGLTNNASGALKIYDNNVCSMIFNGSPVIAYSGGVESRRLIKSYLTYGTVNKEFGTFVKGVSSRTLKMPMILTEVTYYAIAKTAYGSTTYTLGIYELNDDDTKGARIEEFTNVVMNVSSRHLTTLDSPRIIKNGLYIEVNNTYTGNMSIDGMFIYEHM